MDVSSATLISVQSRVESTSGELNSSCVIHPFHVHKMDSGPVRLMTIAHAFNYRVAVLRDGVRSALRVGRSRKAEKCFLANRHISWGQQVAVMFQIVSTLMEEVPAFASRMRELRGEHPLMQFVNDPWGHDEKCVGECDCLVSDRTGAFVHCLIHPLTKQVQVPVIPLMIVKRCRQGLHLEMTVDTWASAVRDQYPLYRRDRARMAG